MTTAPRHRLRWYQYSLRSLFALTVLVAIGGSWLACKKQQVARQRAAVRAIEEMGGSVAYDYQVAYGPWNRFAEPPGPAWLRAWLGDDIFAHVAIMHLRGARVTDAALERLADEHLNALPQLRVLDIEHTKVTDAGLEHLKEMTRLATVRLNGMGVTDAGLEHLKGLTRLTELDLIRTGVTDAGLEHLKGLRQLETLSLANNHITDAGLQHITALTRLKDLELRDTNVTKQGVKKLQQALPNCKIRR